MKQVERGRILVTGAAGYIGSHTLIDLLENGYDVISLDNFSRSDNRNLMAVERLKSVQFRQIDCDLTDKQALNHALNESGHWDAVIHFAAFKSVHESVKHPLLYYQNNLVGLWNLLEQIEKRDIRKLVFSSSCSVYGNATSLPVTEDAPLAAPESPYAATKQMGEQIIRDWVHANNGRAVLLRYFNPVGAHPSALLGERPFSAPNNLVPVITQAAIGINPGMQVWGTDYPTRDGSCIRDYIHVMDIAHAHTLALTYLQHSKDSDAEVFNVGSGKGVSVLEAINAFEKVNGVKVPFENGPRRAGDVIAIYADNRKAEALLGWRAKYSLEDMMQSAWKWQCFLKHES